MVGMQHRYTPMAEAVLKILRRMEPTREVKRLRWDIKYNWLSDEQIRARCAEVDVRMCRELKAAVA